MFNNALFTIHYKNGAADAVVFDDFDVDVGDDDDDNRAIGTEFFSKNGEKNDARRCFWLMSRENEWSKKSVKKNKQTTINTLGQKKAVPERRKK